MVGGSLMSLTFKTKTCPSIPDVECTDLANFLIKEKKFLNLTFDLLARKKDPAINYQSLVNRVMTFYEAKQLSGNASFSLYLDLLYKYYDTNQYCLNHRRGCLLELIVKEIRPLKKGINYHIITESMVLYEGVEISPKDIDVIILYSDIELIECKASVENYLKPEPLEEDKIKKLKLMEDTQKIASKESYDCNIFLATYEARDSYPSAVLKRSGFDTFIVLTKSKILNRL